jgi:alpha-tubulin suppressor-like RCC1 family protein
VAGGLTFVRLASGARHTCGLATDGHPWCWGFNIDGQVGDGSTGGFRTSPVAVAGGLSYASLSAGSYHTCGLSHAHPYCWGWDFWGAAGAGTSATSHPTPVATLMLPYPY